MHQVSEVTLSSPPPEWTVSSQGGQAIWKSATADLAGNIDWTVISTGRQAA